MYNLVPELATAGSQVFWSKSVPHEHARLWRRALQAAPAGHAAKFLQRQQLRGRVRAISGNFLLGVSTPGSEIQFRRQMRSRPGEPITVAGNPPVKFASASFEAENEIHCPADFRLFPD